MAAIGSIEFVGDDGVVHTATLHDDGKWQSKTPGLGRILDEVYDPREADASPAAGRFGCQTVHDAAAWLGGTATLEPFEDGAKDTVY